MSLLNAEDIECVPNYSIQDSLLKLPAIGLQGTSRNNAQGRGAHFTGIHQLTPERTLVLLNGRRMVSTIRDSLGLGVDLQSFPVNMIDNVEVLADGASAIYGSDAVADPCNSAAELYQSNATVQANCAADGVASDFVQNASQLKISAGGNPELQPKTSDSFSFSFTWVPDAIDLSLAADYYDVQVDGAIGTPDPVDVILTCYTSANLSAPECERISRGSSGTIIRFDLLNENLNRLETSGIDLNAVWSHSTTFGELSLNGNVNWLNEYVETSASGAVSDRTGLVAGSISEWNGYPEWRSNLGLRFDRNNWSLGGSWRYLGTTEIFDSAGFDNVHERVGAVNYFDIFAGYRGNQLQVTVGVDNVSDETPPYVPDTSLNTSSIYDYPGRFYYLRMKLSIN